jgi:putative colanic acid biosynthesis acetyltransferase WcaF
MNAKPKAVNTDTHTGPSFSLKSRLGRVLWGVVQSTLFRWSPRPAHIWRVWLLRLFGANVHASAHIYAKATIWAPWNLVIHELAGVADDVTLYSQDIITIGAKAVVSQGSYLCAGSHDFDQPGFPLITAPVTIGAHAWIAAQAFIHPGVTVGEGAVIGARSVVVKDIPEWVISAGNPCKVLKERNRLSE